MIPDDLEKTIFKRDPITRRITDVIECSVCGATFGQDEWLKLSLTTDKCPKCPDSEGKKSP